MLRVKLNETLHKVNSLDIIHLIIGIEQTQIKMRLGMGGIKAYCLIIFLDGKVIIFLFLKNYCPPEMGFNIIGVLQKDTVVLL